MPHQLDRIAALPQMRCHPQDQLHIAQASFSLFDVGFQPVAAVAGFFQPCFAFGGLGGEKLLIGAGQNIAGQPPCQIERQFAVAGQRTHIEQAGADHHILSRQLDAVGDGTHGMPDFQREIPEDVKDEFGQLLGPGGLLVGQEKQQIDIRIRSEDATPVATDRDDFQRFADGSRRGGIGEVRRQPVEAEQHRIDYGGVGSGAIQSIVGRTEPVGNCLPGYFQGRCQGFHGLGLDTVGRTIQRLDCQESDRKSCQIRRQPFRDGCGFTDGKRGSAGAKKSGQGRRPQRNELGMNFLVISV